MEDIMKFMVRFVVKFRRKRADTVLLWQGRGENIRKRKDGRWEGRYGAFRRAEHFGLICDSPMDIWRKYLDMLSVFYGQIYGQDG